MELELVSAILKQSFGFKQGEHVLIVCDDKSERIACAFYRQARKIVAELVLIKIISRRMHGEEPPAEVDYALKAADIAILFTSMSLSHTRARKEASSRYGTRIASLPGVTEEILKRAAVVDYASLKKDALNLAKRLSRAKRLEVNTDAGTHILMSVRGRNGFADHGLYTSPGAFGNLPAGEACIAPIEGSTFGSLVVDASVPLTGRIKQPRRLIIKDGYVQNMPFRKILSLINSAGRNALNIAEFGLGLNPRAKVTGNTLEDEKARQTAHLAIGSNISFGGKISCPCHLDFVFFRPVVYIDGKRLRI